MTEQEFGAMPVRRAPQQKMSFIKTTLLATSALSGIMLGLAVPNLVSGDALMVVLKSAALAVGGLAVSYAVNPIERTKPCRVTSQDYLLPDAPCLPALPTP